MTDGRMERWTDGRTYSGDHQTLYASKNNPGSGTHSSNQCALTWIYMNGFITLPNIHVHNDYIEIAYTL